MYSMVSSKIPYGLSKIPYGLSKITYGLSKILYGFRAHENIIKYYYRRSIGDPSKTYRRPTRDQHASLETHRRPTCLIRDPSGTNMPDWRPIGDQHTWWETHWRPQYDLWETHLKSSCPNILFQYMYIHKQKVYKNKNI